MGDAHSVGVARATQSRRGGRDPLLARVGGGCRRGWRDRLGREGGSCRLGEAVALKILETRANDGATAVDPYRPKTRPGQYVPTATVVASSWPTLRPFVLASPSQFRPGPPTPLKSREWAADYNEIKELGSKNSTKRSAQQTEVARFWLMVGPQAYHPLARQLVLARHLDSVDSAVLR